MNKFKQHIKADKTIELKRPNGEVDVFTLKALPYKFMPEVFELFNKLKDMNGESAEDVMSLFDKETVKLIQLLTLETLKISYPEEPVEELEEFAKNNLMNLLPVVIELNSFSVDEKVNNKE